MEIEITAHEPSYTSFTLCGMEFSYVWKLRVPRFLPEGTVFDREGEPKLVAENRKAELYAAMFPDWREFIGHLYKKFEKELMEP